MRLFVVGVQLGRRAGERLTPIRGSSAGGGSPSSEAALAADEDGPGSPWPLASPVPGTMPPV
jgi:hypothetical protein